MQPCDVEIFRPLKRAWQEAVNEHTQETTKLITKVNFAPIFLKAYIKSKNSTTIKNAFERSGLYPFEANSVNHTKCMQNRHKSVKHSDEDNTESINHQESENEKLLFSIWKNEKELLSCDTMSTVNEFKNTSTAVCSCDDFLIESKDNMENDVSIENNVGIENDVSIENDFGIENAVSIENDVGIENVKMMLALKMIPQVIIELVNITSETDFSSLDLSQVEVMEIEVETSMEVDIGASKPEMSSLLTPERETSQICSQSMDKETYQKILSEHLHFPRIEASKKKANNREPNISSITSEEWRVQQEHKMKKKNEEQEAKEKRKIERENKRKIKEEQAEKKKNERQIKQEVIEKTSKESEAVVEKNTRKKSLAKTASKVSSKAATRASSKASSKATPIARSKASSKATSIARSKATIKTIPKKKSKVLCDITNKGKKEDCRSYIDKS
ncbi:hypothetical protein TKK_0016826 [Trichogramma kaykai]